MFNKIVLIQFLISSSIYLFVRFFFPEVLISNNFFKNICVPTESLHAAYIASVQTGSLFKLSVWSFFGLVVVIHLLLMVRRHISFRPDKEKFLKDPIYRRSLVSFYVLVIFLSLLYF